MAHIDKNKFEYKGEKFSIRWDPKDEILFVTMWGSHTKKDAEEYRDKFYEFAKMIPGKKPIYQLFDVSKQDKSDSEARRIYNELSKNARAGNAAICGANVVVRLIAAFISTATRRKDIKLFSTTQEGVKWLKKMKAKKR
jgi:hypothetical protein